jgi:hypothetical protein
VVSEAFHDPYLVLVCILLSVIRPAHRYLAKEPVESCFFLPDLLARDLCLKVECREDETKAKEQKAGYCERCTKNGKSSISYPPVSAFAVPRKTGPEIDPGIAQPEKQYSCRSKESNKDQIIHDNELHYYTLFHICIITIMPSNPTLQEVLERMARIANKKPQASSWN